MKNNLIFFCVSLLASSALLLSCNTEIKNREYYKTHTKEIIDSAKIPAIQIAYTSPKQNINFGVGEFECEPNEGIFQGASLSKPILAYIVLKMYNNNQIDIDTPLYKYTDIDRFTNKEWAKQLTARMVLNHRTGLPNWSASPTSDKWPTSPIEFKFRPDSCFSYSGEGISLLQRAVETIKGATLQEIAQNEVFNILEMPNTSYEWRTDYENRALYGYNSEGIKRGRGNFPSGNAAYTIRTTATDYSKFINEIMNIYLYSVNSNSAKYKQKCKAEISSEKAAVFFDSKNAIRYAENPRKCDKSIFWGLGIGIENSPELGQIIWHWGDNGTFKALFAIIPSRQSNIAYFTNSAHGHDIINQIFKLYFGTTQDTALSHWILDE